MKKLLLALSLLLASITGAASQNTTCATRPVNDSSNACASTAFVQNQLAVGLNLTHTHILVGNSANKSADFGSFATFSDNGTLTINPAATTTAQGLVINQTGPTSGSAVGPTSFNLIAATYGAATTGSANPFFDNGAWQTWAAAHRVNFSVGGTNLAAQPVGAGFYQLVVNTNSTGFSDGDFIGLAGEAWANATVTNGAFHGLVGAAIMGATSNVRAINGLFAEADILTGGVVVARRGINIVSQGNITATGASDTAINVATSTSAAGFKNMFIIDTTGGTIQPIQTTGDILKSDGAFTIANVFNLPSATVTTNIMNFANFTLSGAGVLKAGAGTADSNTGAMVNAAVTSGGVAALISQADGAAAFNGLHTNTSTTNSALFAVVPEASSATTIFGQTNGNWAEIVSSGSTSNGMLLGTITNDPVIIGANNTERLRVTSTGLNIGAAINPDSLLTINANTAASIAPPTGTLLHLIGADSTLARIVIDAYAQIPVLGGYRANGTQAAKTAVVAADNMFVFGANGWNTSAMIAGAQINFTARETFSGTASGSSVSIFTTPLTTTGNAESTRFQPSGGLAVGATAIATDKGIGTIALDGNLFFTVAAKTITLKQGANGSVGTFVCNGVTPVTVNNTNVAISDAVIISLNTVGGTVGAAPDLKTITAATGFTVACTAADTSTYNYAIIKNAA